MIIIIPYFEINCSFRDNLKLFQVTICSTRLVNLLLDGFDLSVLSIFFVIFTLLFVHEDSYR